MFVRKEESLTSQTQKAKIVNALTHGIGFIAGGVKSLSLGMGSCQAEQGYRLEL